MGKPRTSRATEDQQSTGQVCVRATAPVLGLAVGEEMTVQLTPFLQGVIDGGRLVLVDPAAEEPAPKDG